MSNWITDYANFSLQILHAFICCGLLCLRNKNLTLSVGTSGFGRTILEYLFIICNNYKLNPSYEKNKYNGWNLEPV